MCERMEVMSGAGFICGGKSRTLICACGREAAALCDWKVLGNKSGLCDRPVCAQHSKQVARGKHLCPEHQRAYADWKRRHPPQQGSLFQEASVSGDAT
jgi:hypothetical protein